MRHRLQRVDDVVLEPDVVRVRRLGGFDAHERDIVLGKASARAGGSGS